ncbi:MAG: 23S rRNA (adenine(2503)-C(2))-methyltransferase RlmN, partial [Rhodobiaceae bacterium]|nr:23S rRNA (adenine(2503)-C(2))-methyltransferase RlmN [Rhodobiaceae bacterium]
MTTTLDIERGNPNAPRIDAAGGVENDARTHLVGLTRAELARELAGIGVAERQLRMRANQLWRWIYGRGATDFADMTDIAKGLRGDLAAAFDIARPQIVAEQVSTDGTRKWLIRMPAVGGQAPADVETVYIPEHDRGTLCISSQVGCTLTCTFCHTGTQKLVRNLTAGEILAQIMIARDRLGDWPGGTRPTDAPVPDAERAISNVVLMGM